MKTNRFRVLDSPKKTSARRNLCGVFAILTPILGAVPSIAQTPNATAQASNSAASANGNVPQNSTTSATNASANAANSNLSIANSASASSGNSAVSPSVISSTAIPLNTIPDLNSPLTLDDSIRIALKNQGGIGAAEQGFISAREGIVSARANYFPQVTAGLNYNYQNSNGSSTGNSSGGTTIYRRSATTTDIAITQNIFDGGTTRAQVRQAQARALNAVGGFGSTRSSLAYNVASSFYAQLQQQKLTAQRQGQVALAQQQLEQIQAQVDAGVAARVDVQTVQVTLSQARFDLATSQNDLRSAQTNFRNALGLERGVPLQLQESALSAQTAPVVVPTNAAPNADSTAPATTTIPATSAIAPTSNEENAANRVLDSPNSNANSAGNDATNSNTNSASATEFSSQTSNANRVLDLPETNANSASATNADSSNANFNSTNSSANFDKNGAPVSPNLNDNSASATDENSIDANGNRVLYLSATPQTSALPDAPNRVTIAEFPTANFEPLPVVPQLEALDSYIAEARRLRPDLVQARANVQQDDASVSLAKIASRPQITASAGYNIDPRSTQDRGLVFGAGVSIPLFDGGGRRADVRAAQASLSSSEITLAQLDKDVAADVEITFVAIGGQVARISNARDLVQAAQTNLETASERYRLGLGIVLDVVNAQTQLFSAQTSATQAVYDYELARADLDRAIGRFAWADPGQAPPAQAPKTVPVALSVASAQASSAKSANRVSAQNQNMSTSNSSQN